MKWLLIIPAWLLSMAVLAQSNTLTGEILDEKGEGLGYATVALMYPADSTLAFFGVTNVGGHFEIRNTKPGDYLMQVAYLGYKTLYRTVKLPLLTGNSFGAIVMQPCPISLKEFQVTGEYIPLLFNKDTIEYNAAAFKTKPDAVAVDLLRKLPGVEVDRSGNIRAVGQDVKNVLVDGKEFFGNDLKVATKNVPADAVKKVQVYDKKSDESEFTGISDGSHDKTVNLVLKEDKKKALFGDLMTGGGSSDHYQGSGKLYRFTGANQFAVIGNINNINQFGFSFSDYLRFSGGLTAMGGGGSVQIGITSDNNYPVNFGQPINGYVTSRAAGLNFSHEFRKNNRFYISYLGNAAGTKLAQQVRSQNFFPGGSFIQQMGIQGDEKNQAHRLTFGWKDRIDSTQNFVFSGSASLTTGSGYSVSSTSSYQADSLINTLRSGNSDRNNRFSGNFTGSYIKKLRDDRTNIKLSGHAAYSYGSSTAERQNSVHYYNPDHTFGSQQYLTDHSDRLKGEASVSLTQALGRLFYLEPIIQAGYTGEQIKRKQGSQADAGEITDSLSPVFSSGYFNMKPSVRLKRNTEKTTLSITGTMELGRMMNRLNNEKRYQTDVCFFTPRISWEYEYLTGRRLSFTYASSVNTPTTNQLLPVVNNSNPLVLISGYRSLKPEYIHDAWFNWMLFDQFSFTSLFTAVNFKYTRNKINWSQTINDTLVQTMTLINVPDDYTATASVDFSTPVRMLGLNFHTSLRESWNRGITYVNNVENNNTNLTHRLSVSFDNRKKEKWDVNLGVSFTLTNARYSVQESLNNRYFDLGYFGEVRFTPNDHWSFAASADVTSYNARTFNNMVSIPLIGTEISFYFLKHNRGLLTITGFDLLNKNTGIERVSEMNYLRETRSNIIGRYFMLSFKYRLNKFNDQSRLDIKINRR